MSTQENSPSSTENSSESSRDKLSVNQSNSVYTKITKSCVDKAVLPEGGQTFIRDTELKGFAVRLTPGSKSFILEKRVDGKVRRMTLGRYPEITVEQARKEAQKQLGKIATGGNPIAEKQRDQMLGTTLAQVYQDYIKTRKTLKPKTLYDYSRFMEVAFGDWQSKPILSITKDMVVKRHDQLGENSGEAYANSAMRVLRALLNFAVAQYETADGQPILSHNPVERLTQTRAWYRVERRQTVIRPHQLAPWYQAVMWLREERRTRQSETIADYLLFLVFTGLRKQEGASLKWADVDLKHRTFTISDTKNNRPLMLPLSDFLLQLLEARNSVAESEYVFPSPNSKHGHLIEPRKQMMQVSVKSGVEFALHDLRRTFITTAESLDISQYAVKRLVNHKMSGDVTAGYIISDVERLRDPMQRISAYLLQHMQQNS